MIEREGECRFCGQKTSGYERDDVNNKWVTYNLDKTVHTIQQCRAIQQQKRNPNATAQKQQQKDYSQILNVLLIKISGIEKRLEMMAKEHQEQASVIDSIAQKQTLILEKIGYPKPEPIPTVPKYRCTKCTKIIFEEGMCEDCSKKEEEKYPAVAKLFGKTTDDNKTEEELPKKSWQMISERFECSMCHTTKHNGYDSWGTKICEDCKLDFEGKTGISVDNDEEATATINAIDFEAQRDESNRFDEEMV